MAGGFPPFPIFSLILHFFIFFLSFLQHYGRFVAALSTTREEKIYKVSSSAAESPILFYNEVQTLNA